MCPDHTTEVPVSVFTCALVSQVFGVSWLCVAHVTFIEMFDEKLGCCYDHVNRDLNNQVSHVICKHILNMIKTWMRLKTLMLNVLSVSSLKS